MKKLNEKEMKKISEFWGHSEEKKEERATNQEIKILESGLTKAQWIDFKNLNGFDYLQTFASWKKLGYSIKAGSKGKAIEIYQKTASGNWKAKKYYYFDFSQVKKQDEQKAKNWQDYTMNEWQHLTLEQKLAVLPF